MLAFVSFSKSSIEFLETYEVKRKMHIKCFLITGFGFSHFNLLV